MLFACGWVGEDFHDGMRLDEQVRGENFGTWGFQPSLPLINDVQFACHSFVVATKLELYNR